MTKELIIDGVNVKECRHCMYKGFKAFPQCKLELDNFATACVQHKDCEYKQLQRLKQENEKLKEKHKKLTCKILEVSTLNKTLIESCKNCEDIISYRKALEETKGYFVVLENIIPTSMLSEGSGVFRALKDAKDIINSVLQTEESEG